MPVTGVDDAFKALEVRITGVAKRRAEARARQVLGFARSRWPVGRAQQRPHSRDLFRLAKQSAPGVVRIDINNGAKDARGTPYALYVRSGQVPGAGKRNAWVVLVRNPVLKALRDLARQTARDPMGKGD